MTAKQTDVDVCANGQIDSTRRRWDDMSRSHISFRLMRQWGDYRRAIARRENKFLAIFTQNGTEFSRSMAVARLVVPDNLRRSQFYWSFRP